MDYNELDAPQAAPTAQALSDQATAAPGWRRCFGLLCRRERWGLSLRGWLAVTGVAACLMVVFVFGAYPFLAVTDREPPSEYLIVEGWAPVDILRDACVEFKQGGYQKILVSGCLVFDEWAADTGATYADWGASKLCKLGIPANLVQPIPCFVKKRDRTYGAALAVKQWMDAHGIKQNQINVVTEGSHARRSRLLFQKAFGVEARVGVIAFDDPQFDPEHWWRTSEGVREVLGESIAYLYARFLFHAPK
jgi:hypothetical protein